jgi:hypothetical protein
MKTQSVYESVGKESGVFSHLVFERMHGVDHWVVKPLEFGPRGQGGTFGIPPLERTTACTKSCYLAFV